MGDPQGPALQRWEIVDAFNRHHVEFLMVPHQPNPSIQVTALSTNDEFREALPSEQGDYARGVHAFCEAWLEWRSVHASAMAGR